MLNGLEELMGKKIAAAILIVLLTQTSVYASVGTAPYVTDEMQEAQYWTAQTENAHEVLMTAEEIKALNRNIFKIPATNTCDLVNEPKTVDGIALAEQLSSFEITGTYFIGETPLAQEDIDEVRKNIKNPEAKRTQAVLYGLCTTRADLKAYPIADIVSDAPDDPEYDEFQNSRILVNEPLLICSTTEDHQWYWVKTYSCTGWVEADKIVVCSTRSEWLEAQDPDAFLVVTAEKIRLEANNVTPALSELSLSMGTVLPLADNDEIPSLIDGRNRWNNYVVKIPVRNDDGSCAFKLALVPKNRDVSLGYLPLTYENLLNQMFKMLGNRYGWGSMLEAQDCSSYVMDVYSCFGFRLPRNTTWQKEMPVSKITVAEFTADTKKAVLDKLMPGDLLQFPGHIMMYLGKSEGRYYVISATGSAVIPSENNTGNTVSRIRNVIINDLSLKRANGLTWFEAVADALVVTRQMDESDFLARSNRFVDIEGYWAEASINYVAARGLISGIDADTFAPDRPLTRAMLVTLLWRLVGEPAAAGQGSPFKDVAADSWYKDALDWAGENDIISGIGNNMFAPDTSVTREQFAAILYRYAEFQQADVSASGNMTQFSDYKAISGWAEDAVGWGVGNGFISGRTSGLLDPAGNATRAEAAVILQRYMKK
jgi:hypothetical protein